MDSLRLTPPAACDRMMEATSLSMTLRVGPMTSNTRIDLKVPYAEKNQAKVHGARWDSDSQTWYALLEQPPGHSTIAGCRRTSGHSPPWNNQRLISDRTPSPKVVCLTGLLSRCKVSSTWGCSRLSGSRPR